MRFFIIYYFNICLKDNNFLFIMITVSLIALIEDLIFL